MTIHKTRKHGLELHVVIFRGKEVASFCSREGAERYVMRMSRNPG